MTLNYYSIDDVRTAHTMATSKTLVIKLGTSVLTQGTQNLQQAHMMEIVRQCAAALQQGHKIIIVTSGAIAAGRELLGQPSLPPLLACKQMLAAVGQSRLIQLWEQLFAIYDIRIGQMLLTRADFEDKERFLNAKDTLHALLDYGIVPIINENDAVATAEIKVGDNDNLSALVAILGKADVLLLLTDQVGLFTADPRKDPHATLIKEVPVIDASIHALAGGSGTSLGTGGMATKIQAAEVATRAGIGVVIAAGAEAKNIATVLRQEPTGTLFLPNKMPLETRKQWLFGPPTAGIVHIDAGATTALLHKGSSLLPKGISKVSGVFSRGAVIKIISAEGEVIAHGVTRYGSEDIQRIAGHHSDQIEALLGYTYGSVVIHRDDCIILGPRPATP